MILYPDWTWDTIPDEFVEDVMRAIEICSPNGCSKCPLKRDYNGIHACLCWLPAGDEIKKLESRLPSNVKYDISDKEYFDVLTAAE